MGHRVLVVVGTRPEAIKMAPVVAALRSHAPEVETRLALTGQHTTLVDQVVQAFDLHLDYELAADYDLDIMREGQSLYDVVGGVLQGVREVLGDCRPDMLLVQGDTATVFAASLAAFFEGVGVGHVEAGLRSHDKRAPWPEEVVRRLTDVVADHHFVPTPRARAELLAENMPGTGVHLCGNTVIDALLTARARDRPIADATLKAAVEDAGTRLVLLTAHRRESFGAPIREVFGAVRELADRLEDVRVVHPVHPNPEVAGPAHELLGGHPRVHLTDPLDYLDLVAALGASRLVLTDSGGIQEEAPTFGTPVLVLRRVTERPEGIEAGVAELVGTDGRRIVERAIAALGRPVDAKPATNPYGDGRAGERIADIVVSALTGRPRTTEDWSP